MSTCNVTYSAETIRGAARAYFWRRLKSLGGVCYLLSTALVLGAICFIYFLEGANWFVGAFGVLLFLNLTIQLSYYFSAPRVLARILLAPGRSTLGLETQPEGVRVDSGRNSAFLPWSRFRYIWEYQAFFLLVPDFPVLRFAFVIIPTDGMTPEVRHDLQRASQIARRSPGNHSERP